MVRKPELQELPKENKPFKSTYHRSFKPHQWLAERGLTQETLDHFGSGYYDNLARKSVYNGSVMLRISRYSDGECVGYLSLATSAR